MFSLKDYKPALRTWAVAAVFHKQDGGTTHSVRIVRARSFEEALGLAYFQCRETNKFVSMGSAVCQEITDADMQTAAIGVLP